MIRHFEETVEYDTPTQMKQDYFAHIEKYGTKGLTAHLPGIIDHNQPLQVVYSYDAATEPQPASVLEHPPGPEQLPPHIQATYNLELSCEDVSEISKVMNDIERYWPGMKLQQYGVAQKAGIPAYAAITLVNYDVEEEDTSVADDIIKAVAENLDVDPDELKEELGDIGVL